VNRSKGCNPQPDGVEMPAYEQLLTITCHARCRIADRNHHSQQVWKDNPGHTQ
jgi:hypothetical protein